MSDRAERTRLSYDAVASNYLERRRDRSAMSSYVNAFASRLAPGALLLDVGCGPGFDAAEFRARGFRAIGLDRSWGMLSAGLAEWPGPRAQVDMRELPVRAGIDGLWVSASMLHVERGEVPGTLAGFQRALSPGGLLFVLLKGGEGEGWDERRYGVEAPRWFTYWGEDEIDAALVAAGFDVEARLGDHLEGQHWIARIARATDVESRNG